MFGLLEKDLHGPELASDNEVKDAVHMWHQTQAKFFLQMGSEGL
jgi:hypothetical protein